MHAGRGGVKEKNPRNDLEALADQASAALNYQESLLRRNTGDRHCGSELLFGSPKARRSLRSISELAAQRASWMICGQQTGGLVSGNHEMQGARA